MDSIRVFCDSIKNVVNVSCKCAEAKSDCPTNWADVVIVGIIAVAVCWVIYHISTTVESIIKMKKHEGMRSILKDMLKKECFKENNVENNE